MDTIKSRANQHIKYARAVRDSLVTDRFFVEGSRLVNELLASAIKVASVYLSVQFAEKHIELTSRLNSLNIPVRIVTASVFPAIADTKNPQGIAAVAITPDNSRQRIEAAINENTRSLAVMLHKTNNPGNLGAVIRSAEAFGASGVVVTRDSADPYKPASIRGSMGSAFRVPIWSGVEFGTAVDWAKNNGLSTICADVGAKSTFGETDWNRNVFLVLGSEGHGLGEDELRTIDEHYQIKMAPGIESLNLSVAAGIILFTAAQYPNS